MTSSSPSLASWWRSRPTTAWSPSNPGGGANEPGWRISRLMTDEAAESEATVDPDEAIRDELRAKLREIRAEEADQPDRPKRRNTPFTEAQEAALGPTLF